MKKVWILERFFTPDDLKQQIAFSEAYVQKCEKDYPEHVMAAKEMLESARRVYRNNPEGHWVGMEGKSVYSIFCRVAKQSLRITPDAKYRVVTAEIADDAKYWLGYVNPIVNEGVLRYLRATA